jgi:hypothetical protein
MTDHSQILDEHKIDLHETTRLLGTNGKPTHLSTALRAITKGIKSPLGDRVFLEALRLGGRWITSREAVERFTARLTAAALGDTSNVGAPPNRTTRQRQRELDRVDRELTQAGF